MLSKSFRLNSRRISRREISCHPQECDADQNVRTKDFTSGSDQKRVQYSTAKLNAPLVL